MDSLFPQADKPPQPSPEELEEKKQQLEEAAATAKRAQEAQHAADQARQRAAEATDPEWKVKALEEVADKEKEARLLINKASTLQNGALQGGFAGAGIGAATGMGVGTVVGTLVGGITSIPTTGLGLLVGAGIGAVHGPWLTVEGKKKEQELGLDSGEEEKGGSAEPVASIAQDLEENHPEPKSPKKPRKLEIRGSNQNKAASSPPEDSHSPAT